MRSEVITLVLLFGLPHDAVFAADPKVPVAQRVIADESVTLEFLEYLGSLEDVDDNWTDLEVLSRKTASAAQEKTDRLKAVSAPNASNKASNEPVENRQ